MRVPIIVGALIGCTVFFVLRRFLLLACAMKRLRDAAGRRDVAGETACSVCKGASTATGPVFQMRAVGMPSQGMLERIRATFMPERIRVVLPMCPECHIRLIRFDFRCTVVMLGWCIGFLVALALLVSMPRIFPAPVSDVWCRPEFVLACVFLPIALHALLVMPRYYKSIIGHPLIANMVHAGYTLATWGRSGNVVESCDWVELVGDVATYAATTGLQRLDDHVYAEPPRLGRGVVAALLLLALALAVGPAIVKLVNGGFDVRQDIVFGGAIPVSVQTWVLFVNLLLAFFLVPIISCLVARSPRRMPWVREAMWLFLALYAAYALHVLDAYLYWGTGMSMHAATGGFVMARFLPFMAAFIVLMGFMFFLNFAFSMKESKEARKQGITPRPPNRDVAVVFRAGLWWTILSLVLFELHIAIWFALSNSMAKNQAQSCDRVCFPQCCFSTNVTTVALVMPASVLPKREFDCGKAALESAGYKVKVMPRMDFGKVAPPDDRVADLEQAWLDPEVDLVLCATGGTGTEELLDKIDWAKLRTRPQRVLGFSNITLLVNAMLKENAGRPYCGPTRMQGTCLRGAHILRVARR